jgi:hypothetical protein
MAAAETVYKWVDGSRAGPLHRPAAAPGDAKVVASIKRSPASPKTTDPATATTRGRRRQRRLQAADLQAAHAEPPVPEKRWPLRRPTPQKRRFCSARRRRIAISATWTPRRLFRETPDGKRVYLTDQELTEARARAKQAVNDYCS